MNAAIEGERRRDIGMALAAEHRQRLVWQSQLALLDAIRCRPGRMASTDDTVDDRWTKFPNGGKWRGMVPRELARMGLIRRHSVIRSTRSARHRGYLTLWTGTDDARIDAYRDQLARWLAATNNDDLDCPLFQNTSSGTAGA